MAGKSFFFILMYWMFGGYAVLNATQLEVTENGTVLSAGNARIESPPEGLWSISTDWTENWPVAWVHANPEKVVKNGPWTIAYGTIQTAEGLWHVRDAYRDVGYAVKVIRRFEWKGSVPFRKATLSVRWLVNHDKPQIIMPSVLYCGNPAGEKTGHGLVPVFHGNAGDELIVEEHRYPMPFISKEWSANNELLGAAVHSLPSPAPYANKPDQWWSFGVIGHEGKSEIILLSGPCAMNGKRSVVKANQAFTYPYGDAWLDIPPGGIIEKTFYLQAYEVNQEGAGFQSALSTSLDIFKPDLSGNMPTIREIIEDKYRLAKTRWITSDGAQGYSYFHPEHMRQEIVFGWCGQAALPAYALPVLERYLDDPDIITKAQSSLDFLTTAPFDERGFLVRYDLANNAWSRSEPLSQGQGMDNIANAIIYARKREELNTSKWEVFLKKASEFHANRILDDHWQPVSTNEAFLISPLYKAAELFENEKFAEAAEKATIHYGHRHLSMKEPYWGGTLDARAEDKEGAWAAFQAFLTAYEYAKNETYLRWAQHACDLMLTYTVVWDIPMPAGRMTDHGFKTRGWTSVSVQNHHLDVYGVLTAPSVYKLGQYLNDQRYKDLAMLMYRSCGQIIDPYGSQGEQVQQTNYLQRGRGKVNTLEHVRGGYFEDWTVFWITAHFLNAAAQFEEMGVSLE
jgi:hypothetical protein